MCLGFQLPEAEQAGNTVVGILDHIISHFFGIDLSFRILHVPHVRGGHLHVREFVELVDLEIEILPTRIESDPPKTLVVFFQGEFIVLASQEEQPRHQFSLGFLQRGVPPREVFLVKLDIRHIPEAVSDGIVLGHDLTDRQFTDCPDIDRSGQGQLLHERRNLLFRRVLRGSGFLAA